MSSKVATNIKKKHKKVATNLKNNLIQSRYKHKNKKVATEN